MVHARKGENSMSLFFLPSRKSIQKEIEKKIKEKPNISDWTEDEKQLIKYDIFCEFLSSCFVNIIFYAVIIWILINILIY